MGTTLNCNQDQLEYTGEREYQPQAKEKNEETEEPLYAYIPSKELVEAVNLAIKLNRPLLLEGEPGCGKTQLARAVAYEFSKRYQDKIKIFNDKGEEIPNNEGKEKKWPYADWYIKSSDQARDGLYIYDAVRRLFDAQLAATDPSETKEIRTRLNDPEHKEYIQYKALGHAFEASQKGQRMVVLIDEIDKADTDFPNDLLLELEEKRFIIKETGKEVRANPDFAPIIFITSNGQRKLPDAFLRRCLYHYIEFPNEQGLIEIVEAHFGNKFWSKQLRQKAVNRFIDLRKLMEEEKGEFGKKVSTSELIDWFRALQPSRTAKEIRQLFKENNLPCSSVLLKSRDDLQLKDLLNEQEDTDGE